MIIDNPIEGIISCLPGNFVYAMTQRKMKSRCIATGQEKHGFPSDEGQKSGDAPRFFHASEGRGQAEASAACEAFKNSGLTMQNPPCVGLNFCVSSDSPRPVYRSLRKTVS